MTKEPADAPDPLAALVREQRGSDRYIEALLAGPLYVLGRFCPPRPDGTIAFPNPDPRVTCKVGGAVVLPVFSSWGQGVAFLAACGLEEAEIQEYHPAFANDFILNAVEAGARIVLNPKTPYERELWQEEARLLPRLSGADGALKGAGAKP